VARFRPPYRRFGGILVDVYFDHFLAREWAKYCSVPLPDFITEVYRDIESCLPAIPAEAARPLHRMLEENWLGSYHRISGMADILRRISRRLRRPFDLAGSVPMFAEHESAFLDDFHAFFPELLAHVQQASLNGCIEGSRIKPVITATLSCPQI
jgi:acyl carrier protein phosphodiesterase